MGASTVLVAPLAAEAQPAGKIHRLGYLSPSTFGQSKPYVDVFLQTMRERGYVESQNVKIEWRFADGKIERLPDLAAELVRSRVDVIVVWSTDGAIAAKRATVTIPIVMGSGSDAVAAGLVSSLARPGGNVTGLSGLHPEVSRKWPELLRETMPTLSRVGVIFNSGDRADVLAVEGIRATSGALNLRLLPLEAGTPSELKAAFEKLRNQRVEAIIVTSGPTNFSNQAHIFELAAASRLPALYGTSDFARAGGLLSYGLDFLDNARKAAEYVDKILRGAKPADLPVEQPTKLELVINLKTAKALGLTIPQSVLLRADHVIE
jgi:putative ABC transport system substrate-binding protein